MKINFRLEENKIFQNEQILSFLKYSSLFLNVFPNCGRCCWLFLSILSTSFIIVVFLFVCFAGHIATQKNPSPTFLIPRYSPCGQILINEICAISRGFLKLFLPFSSLVAWASFHCFIIGLLHEEEIKFPSYLSHYYFGLEKQMIQWPNTNTLFQKDWYRRNFRYLSSVSTLRFLNI